MPIWNRNSTTRWRKWRIKAPEDGSEQKERNGDRSMEEAFNKAEWNFLNMNSPADLFCHYLEDGTIYLEEYDKCRNGHLLLSSFFVDAASCEFETEIRLHRPPHIPIPADASVRFCRSPHHPLQSVSYTLASPFSLSPPILPVIS